MKLEIYDYLTLFRFGKENAISMPDLAKDFGVSERRLRSIINQINDDPNLEYRVKKGDPAGYYIIERLEDVRHTRNRAYKQLLQAHATIQWANEEMRTHGQVVWNDEDIEIKRKYKGELK